MNSPVPLEEGIALLESGGATKTIRIDFGGGVHGSVSEAGTLEGLLQRARGVRLIKMMAERQSVDRPAHMRNGKPALTPLVEEILDALRPSD
ncbi:hypothetical protein [Henriciella sp.]|uniref:hypothetical protein n=1 Tax=Henriciella sp. TaxID=1968823 RepID=UPI00261449EF|nr:hypothetical protein [Henriciella sp.]